MGKTTAILNALIKLWILVDTLIICAAAIDEPKYELMQKWGKQMAKDRERMIEDYHRQYRNVQKENRPPEPKPFQTLFVDRIDDVPNVRSWKKGDEIETPIHTGDYETRRAFLLVDDMINEKSQFQSPICDMFIRGRKYNISTVYIAHSFFAIPPMMRKNTPQYILFGGLTKTNIMNIAKGIATGLEDDEFHKLYKTCVEEDIIEEDDPDDIVLEKKSFPFMLIDLAVSSDEGQFKEVPRHQRKAFMIRKRFRGIIPGLLEKF